MILTAHHYVARRFAEDVAASLADAFGVPVDGRLSSPVNVVASEADACSGQRLHGDGVARYVRLTLRCTAGHGFAAPAAEAVLDALDVVLPAFDGASLGELGHVIASDIERVVEHESGVTVTALFEAEPVAGPVAAPRPRPRIPVGRRAECSSLRWLFAGLDCYGTDFEKAA